MTTLADVTVAADAYAKAEATREAAMTTLLRTVREADRDRAAGRMEILAASGLSRRTIWRAFGGPREEEPAETA
jgi:hypothetical protein